MGEMLQERKLSHSSVKKNRLTLGMMKPLHGGEQLQTYSQKNTTHGGRRVGGGVDNAIRSHYLLLGLLGDELGDRNLDCRLGVLSLFLGSFLGSLCGLEISGLTFLQVFQRQTNESLEDLCGLLDDLLGGHTVSSNLLVVTAPRLGPTQVLCALLVQEVSNRLVGCEGQEATITADKARTVTRVDTDFREKTLWWWWW